MILNVISAEYIADYKILLTFNNGESVLTDLELIVKSDQRKIFYPLRAMPIINHSGSSSTHLHGLMRQILNRSFY